MGTRHNTEHYNKKKQTNHFLHKAFPLAKDEVYDGDNEIALSHDNMAELRIISNLGNS